jgi:CelD/BcsL family acetyltransferase involved in cellulose biosynthesis
MPVTESRRDPRLGARDSAGTREPGIEIRAALETTFGRAADPESRIPSPESRLTIQCIDDPAAFTAMRGEWNDLLRASAADNPFLTWEWLHAWWLHLGESSGLRLIVVRSGGELMAIAPLRVVHSTVYRTAMRPLTRLLTPLHRMGVPGARSAPKETLSTSPGLSTDAGALDWFSRLEFLGTGHAGSDYLDLIVRRGHEAESVDAIAQYLNANQIAMRLNHLAPSSLGARLAAQVAGDGWTCSLADDGTCPVIPLAGLTFDGYLATLGPSHRANFRRRLKGLGQKFELRFEPVRTHRERCDMLAALVAFHERRWKAEGGSSAFMTPAVIAFQDEVTRHALDAGWLRMYVLRLNGETAAVMYGFHYGGRFYFYQHGFDDRYQAHSVGLVLMGLTIRAAVEEGAAEFDMLWGVEPYKFLWARETRTLQRVELFPVHFGGTVQRHALEARRNVKNLARRVLAIGESLGS